MAEELDLRSIWNKSKKLENPRSLQLDLLEKKGTKTTLYWIKIILWIEFILSIVFIPFIVIFLKEEPTWTKIVYVAVTLIYLVYYQFLIKQINHFNYDKDLLTGLKKVYRYLWFYKLHYKVMIWLSLSIGFFAALLAPENANTLTGTDFAILMVISFILLLIIGGFFQLILFFVYGKKIRRLKQMVKDLSSEG